MTYLAHLTTATVLAAAKTAAGRINRCATAVSVAWLWYRHRTTTCRHYGPNNR